MTLVSMSGTSQDAKTGTCSSQYSMKLTGHSRVISNIHTGLTYYKLLAALGFLTVGIHSLFLLNGSELFRQTVSVALLVATFTLSTWQLIALRGMK
ncbi:hypothetical protein GTP41_14505 [Pseudoduganella sp. DS3]|uniref:Transmembrane protein n=1 Tax=Pseudoduganella guangdongensis TaxID=2692179 RepID=A0A6N9HKR2_9BURK|nr:DUF6713 family protein [Pseudoduganella guangdongensis]MYN03305.1 hypothetical protein [Pseudoduganella guangdongensis]